MLILRTSVLVQGGKGGNGHISFRREKFVSEGGPDGGDGGEGGCIYLRGSDNIRDLAWAVLEKAFFGDRGADGGGGKKAGKRGKDRFVDIPLGTKVWEKEWNGSVRCIAEVMAPGDEVLVARGGQGGRGNVHFVSSTNKVPLLAEEGDTGEERELVLEMRPLVDVAIVSLANAGKSQLLQHMTRARVEVTEHPFSTREPVVGIATHGWTAFKLAELPSLCPQAHEGKGLGNSFLCFALRAKALLLLVDGAAESPEDDLRVLREELIAYSPELMNPPQVVVVNKVDLPDVKDKVPTLRRRIARGEARVHFVSAMTGEGVDDLLATLAALVEAAPVREQHEEVPPPVLRPHPRRERPSVSRSGDVFVVSSSGADRLVALPDLRQFRVRLQLRRELAKLGVLHALEEAGVKPGDTVRIGRVDLPWE
ncbi:MAG: Obg family GTPase CgtA [Chloroflexi bacterium]|nr:Obg family GTPase CgtA [Chloroflexota bacterium]